MEFRACASNKGVIESHNGCLGKPPEAEACVSCRCWPELVMSIYIGQFSLIQYNSTHTVIPTQTYPSKSKQVRQLSGLAYIPTCRSSSPNQQWPSVCRTRFAAVRPVRRTRLTTVSALSIFTFWPRGLIPGPKFTKRSGGLQQAPLCHPAKFQPDCANGLQDVRYRSFHFLVLGANSVGRSSPKGEITCYPPRSTVLPNSIALRQPMPEVSLTKVSCGQRKKKQ